VDTFYAVGRDQRLIVRKFYALRKTFRKYACDNSGEISKISIETI